MNIDDLKGAWKNDEPSRGTSFKEMVMGKSISPIERIRSNMRMEFIVTIITYAIMLWFLFRNQQSSLFFNSTLITVFVLLILNTYYFTRFYIFYNSMSRFDVSTKESVERVAFDLQLNIELYRAYNLCVTPFALMITIFLLCGKWAITFLSVALNSQNAMFNLGYVLAALLISFVLTYLFTELHLRSKYGKPLKELKAILNELNTQEV